MSQAFMCLSASPMTGHNIYALFIGSIQNFNLIMLLPILYFD